MGRPFGVICHWELIVSEKRDDCQWKLHQSYVIDDDGYPLTIKEDREFWRTWTHEEVFYYNNEWKTKKEFEEAGVDSDELMVDDYRPIMSRAVTMWNEGEGVLLLEFNPPEYVSWLETGFYEKLKKNREWTSLIVKGYELWTGTIDAFHKYFKLKGKK